jgi:hypothetical protein
MVRLDEPVIPIAKCNSSKKIMHEGWEFTMELKIKFVWKKNTWVLAYLLEGKKTNQHEMGI